MAEVCSMKAWKPRDVVLSDADVIALIRAGVKPYTIRAWCMAVNVEIGWVLATRGGLSKTK